MAEGIIKNCRNVTIENITINIYKFDGSVTSEFIIDEKKLESKLLSNTDDSKSSEISILENISNHYK